VELTPMSTPTIGNSTPTRKRSSPALPAGYASTFPPEQPGAAEEIKLAAGTAVIVPRGRWHRIDLAASSDIMAVTLPRGSRL
jgi:hypothetical protein